MNIAILGCGWLGLPLAKSFIEEGNFVKGSTTNRNRMQELKTAGITPYVLHLFAEGIQGDISAFLAETEVLIIDIPPGLRKDPQSDFVGKIGRLAPYIEKSPVKNVLFISSTSVFEDTEDFPEITEEDQPDGTSKAAQQLISAENLLKKNKNFETTVLRFGGLLGPERHPVNFLAGRSGIKNPKAPVNLIKQEDCIGIIHKIIEKKAWGTELNASWPEHPSKEEYYTGIAKEKNLAAPEFDHGTPSKGKIINTDKLRELLEFEFKKDITN
ncbi:SDR family NAD(P)-dependent oxidoreductase [Salegentibacter chungangensis]|uniref:SDR family NAD(P)-dependent oxidoreductase n=1 Tax=Salegentibacter chungangensis TaxID=1335724 RepID=A0ABW3NNE1_9FLAO